jgi:hypothetical protein
VKGREGLRQGYAIIVRSEDQALEYLHLFGIVGSWFLFPGIADRTSGLGRQHGGTRALDHWERGEGHRSLHISRFSWNPPSKGTQNNRASRSQLHWMCFPKKKTETEDSRVKNPALQRCVKEANGGTGVFASGRRETPAFLALGCQVVGSAGRGHTCLVAPSTC